MLFLLGWVFTWLIFFGLAMVMALLALTALHVIVPISEHILNVCSGMAVVSAATFATVVCGMCFMAGLRRVQQAETYRLLSPDQQREVDLARCRALQQTMQGAQCAPHGATQNNQDTRISGDVS